jgi:antitoxin FitA
MTTAITVRNVPTEIRDELAARAAGVGSSLQEFLLAQFVEITARPPLDVVVQRARARVKATKTHVNVGDILSARDQDRR